MLFAKHFLFFRAFLTPFDTAPMGTSSPDDHIPDKHLREQGYHRFLPVCGFPSLKKLICPGSPGFGISTCSPAPHSSGFLPDFFMRKSPFPWIRLSAGSFTMAAAACGTPGLRTIYCCYGEMTYARRIPADKQRNTTIPVSIAVIRAGHKAVHRRGHVARPP